jgi:hypothetical protein
MEPERDRVEVGDRLLPEFDEIRSGRDQIGWQ